MQPSAKVPGSFIGVETLKRDLEAQSKARAQAAPISEEEIEAKVQEAEKAIQAGTQKDAAREKTQEEKDRERLMEIKKNLEQRLGMSFSEEDLSEYILKGSVSKEVDVIPGLLKAVFKTLSTEEFQDIDEKMREVTSKEKLTSNGLENERVFLTLSKVWVGIREKKKSAVWSGTPRMFGKTEADRGAAIRKMGAMVIQYASEAWTNYNTLLKIAFEEDELLKK